MNIEIRERLEREMMVTLPEYDWQVISRAIQEALAEDRARVLLLIEKNYTDEIEELRLSNNGLKSKEKFEKVIGIYKNSLLSSLKENDM